MKGEPIQNLLREQVWRRKLSETERSELKVRPESLADLELESRLTEALGRLQDSTVASNFTARVLQAVEREELEALKKPARRWFNWRVWLPRSAVAAVLIGLAGLTIQHHEADMHRAQLARSVAQAANAQQLPSVDALKNFNAIQRMGQPQADPELLALLQ